MCPDLPYSLTAILYPFTISLDQQNSAVGSVCHKPITMHKAWFSYIVIHRRYSITHCRWSLASKMLCPFVLIFSSGHQQYIADEF